RRERTGRADGKVGASGVARHDVVAATQAQGTRVRGDVLLRRIRKFCRLPRRAWSCVIRRRTAGSWRDRTCKSRPIPVGVLFPMGAYLISKLCACDEANAPLALHNLTQMR